jgi:hypothetical protein
MALINRTGVARDSRVAQKVVRFVVKCHGLLLLLFVEERRAAQEGSENQLRVHEVEAGEVACIATSGTASGSTESVRRAESVKRPLMPTKIQMNKMVPSKAAITLNDPAAVSSMDDGCSIVVALL